MAIARIMQANTLVQIACVSQPVISNARIASSTYVIGLILAATSNQPESRANGINVGANTTSWTISSNSFYEDSGGQRTYLGDYYAIAEKSTNDVRYWERER